MNANEYWTMFMQTGAPAIYLMYKNAKQMEEANVSDCAGPCGACNGIQGAGFAADSADARSWTNNS